MAYSHSLLRVSSLRNIFDFKSYAKCFLNTSSLKISVILFCTDSVGNLSYFLFPKVLTLLFSVIHFQKYFFPQPLLHRIACLTRLVDLHDMEHDLVLGLFAECLFTKLLGKLH